MKKRISIFALVFITLIACNKKEDELKFTKATFNIKLKSDVADVAWGTINNTNAAGNKFSINTLNFYISNITLKGNKSNFSSNKIFYVDPQTESFNKISLDSIPEDTYTEMTFNVGLDASHNVSYAIDATTENTNMIWPSMMGGGYHFLKMEGHYLDLAGVSKGYAIHLGNNANLVTVTINYPLIQLSSEQNYKLFYNINAIFSTPYTYDLNKEKNYTMSDPSSMTIIKNNFSDVFTVQ